ncbi:MAG: PTPA-CTERM sorting domain-containing protein [Leptolyngbyaceae cyanobacterium bins.349]|nr:PTPA-CTERM sorting domain-containing protein [Leptolyngbyaceae cyanobacterium bins.349]
MMASTIAKTSLMAVAIATTSAVSLTLAAPAQAAGFTGDYAPSNFTLTNFNTDGVSGVDLTNAPNSITLVGSDIGGGNITNVFPFGFTLYSTTAAASGVVSFDWAYSTSDDAGANWDPFGVLLNGSFTQLTNNAFNQSGAFSFNVAQGDNFGFALVTLDNLNGRAYATISNFNAPTAIPTPALLPGLIGMGIAAIRKRRTVAVEETTEV